MFNKYNTREFPQQVEVTTTVEEKRAPTDESVKILMEMEQAALDKILMCVKLDSNVFNARWYIIPDSFSYTIKGTCKFILNGRDHEFNFTLPHRCSKEGIVEHIRTQIVEKLSNVLTHDLFTKNIDIIRDNYKF